MIRPACFYANPETALDNTFQSLTHQNKQTNQLAQNEFDQVVSALEKAGVSVCVVQDNLSPETPDSIFPNNRLTFHSHGLAIAYPMKAKNRQKERALDVFPSLSQLDFFTLKHLLDYTEFENQHLYLEGTGSMILDRQHKRVFAALSGRTDSIVIKQFCRDFGYESFLFEAGLHSNNSYHQIYHTNVMLSIGEDYALIALDAITNHQKAEQISEQLARYGKNLIIISPDQMKNFCANILQLKDNKNNKIIVMSNTAYTHLTLQQRRQLEKESRIIHVDIPNIEQASGGSVRCMLAEVF